MPVPRSSSRSAGPARPPRQRRKATRPQELLDAALQLFVAKGFAATRADDVAREAGVSKGTMYLYYPSKEDLFKAVVRHNLVNLIQEGQAIVDGFEGSTSDLLRLLVQLWWERFGATDAAGIHKVVIAEVRNFPELAQFYVDEVIAPADLLFSSTVQRGITRGEFRALPVHEVSHALMAPLIFMSLHRHSFGACPVHGDRLDPVAVLTTQLDLVLKGLERRGRAAPRAATRAAPKAAGPSRIRVA